MTSKHAEQVQAAITQQERTNAIILAALQDEEFMTGVLEAQQAEKNGDEGELLADVIKRLKLV